MSVRWHAADVHMARAATIVRTASDHVTRLHSADDRAEHADGDADPCPREPAPVMPAERRAHLSDESFLHFLRGLRLLSEPRVNGLQAFRSFGLALLHLLNAPVDVMNDLRHRKCTLVIR